MGTAAVASAVTLLGIGVAMRLYDAIVSLIEAWAESLRTDTLEREFDNADWAEAQACDDEDC